MQSTAAGGRIRHVQGGVQSQTYPWVIWGWRCHKHGDRRTLGPRTRWDATRCCCPRHASRQKLQARAEGTRVSCVCLGLVQFWWSLLKGYRDPGTLVPLQRKDPWPSCNHPFKYVGYLHLCCATFVSLTKGRPGPSQAHTASPHIWPYFSQTWNLTPLDPSWTLQTLVTQGAYSVNWAEEWTGASFVHLTLCVWGGERFLRRRVCSRACEPYTAARVPSSSQKTTQSD